MVRKCERNIRPPPHKVLLLLWICLLLPSAAEAGLYSLSDQIILLNAKSVESVLVNSTAAIVAEFYASWCGHCVAFSPVYKTLARDIKEWKPAVDLAAVDCAAMETRQVCLDYGVKGYPTIKFFHAYSKDGSRGLPLKDFPRDVRRLRHRIIDQLEKHPEQWPPACPPLEPISQAEVDAFFQTNSVEHLALIFEDDKSYIGREVTLDLLQFENIAVRRVLSTQKELVTRLGVTDFPSCYLYYSGGNFTRLQVNMEARTFYSYALQRLPGVVRAGIPRPGRAHLLWTVLTFPRWHRSRVYMADLESTLDYSLRVELASSGAFRRSQSLPLLKKSACFAHKYFPGRPMVMNLLQSLNTWLQDQSGDEISYEELKKRLDSTAQTPNAALPEGARWVACQGSQPHLRRFPCGVWTLFHVSYRPSKKRRRRSPGSFQGPDPQEVLSAMRSYVRHFFGCRPCAQHFEEMAEESLSELSTLSAAVLWLWSRHNRVNNRLAGDLSEDPNFPKIQWPPPEMCPTCHSLRENGEHRWNQDQVLAFLVSYYSANNILTAQPTALSEEEEEEVQDEAAARREAEGGEEATAGEMTGKVSAPTTWAKHEMMGEGRPPFRRRPSIVGMKMREKREDIRTLQRKEEPEPGPVFGLGMELDAGLGMVGLQPLEEDFDPDLQQQAKRRQKRELGSRYSSEEAEWSRRRAWMSVLSIGFTRADVSLCVVLYFLSSVCLLAMYLFFKSRLKEVKGHMRRPTS
uniref:Sulfhydryl oxidase n=1 Tax=Tetraodon nigroviridis TaxID=99883 RepID=H3DDH8_TETNG